MNCIRMGLLTLLMVSTLEASAQEAQEVQTGEVEATTEEVKEANRDFAGISFGVGLSVSADVGGDDRVKDALIDLNGIVRVNKKENLRARIMLESHYFFPLSRNETTGLVTAGHGPFVAVQPGTDEIIEAIGLGYMVGFRRAESINSSFNLGVAYLEEPTVRALGREFKENQPAPKGPDGEVLPLRFQERNQGAILVIVSSGW